MNDVDVKNLLMQFVDPYSDRDWVSSKALKNIVIVGDCLKLDFVLGYPIADVVTDLTAQLISFLKKHSSFQNFDIQFSQNIINHRVQQGLKGVSGIKNIIAIGSGKGGVGKSTVSANFALALSKAGARVGLLDADIYGPSLPQIMGSYEAPKIENKRLHPIVRHGLVSMSMGYLVDENTPMIWRGPMVSSTFQQLLNDTLWGELDYLIIDLPPGTGDIQLTLCQKIPLSAAIIVTTPQDLSLIDARRAIEMFRKVKVPVLGVIENMSFYHCPKCGHEDAIFGEGAGLFLQEREGINLLGSLPLDGRIRADADQGLPTVAAAPDCAVSLNYREIARRAAAKLALEAKDFASKMPNIVIESK